MLQVLLPDGDIRNKAQGSLPVLRGGENRLLGLLEGVSIASSGKQGSKGDRVKPLFKYGFCDYGSVNKQWGGYALFRERVRLL
ncbi:hypothetical protein GQ457_03G009240 [Hibiscus cannabinus]